MISSPSQLYQVQAGEVLVCQITAPSWAPVFTKIAGAVSDIGGIMAHAAIGTTTIKTGQRVRVDGSKGIVTLLD